MITTNKLAVSLVMLVSFLSLDVCAQSAAPELKHFASDLISFDHPPEYSVADESTTETQRLVLTRRGSSVQLTIVVPRDVVLRKDLPAAIENSTEPLIKQITERLVDGKKPPDRTSIKSSVGSKEADGVRLRSSGRITRTGEVIWVRLNLRLISIALVRSQADESAGTQLWETIRSSLTAEAPVITAMKAEEKPTGKAITGGVLNGKAVSLPQPAYPPIAPAAHASGTVTVKVLIDEQGNVKAAHAIDGHPLLRPVCLAAAREAKFSPTLLEGEPVKVTGVIQYNFVAQ